jgi:hypothetical protein
MTNLFTISAPIIDTTEILATLSPASINDSGTLAFHGIFNTNEQGIFIYHNDELTTLVTNDYLPNQISLNNNNALAYVVNSLAESLGVSNITLLLDQNQETTTIINLSQEGLESKGISSFQINDQDNAVVQTFWSSPGIFLSDIILVKIDEEPEAIASGGSSSSLDFIRVNAPVINNQNTVAYLGTTKLDFTTSIYVTDGRIISFDEGRPEDLVLNDLGVLAFSWTNAIDDEKLFQNIDSQNILLADTNGLFNDFKNISFNNNGTLVFNAVLDNGVEGIFAGFDPVEDLVIAVGDSLFGSTVVDLDFSSEGLNNSDVITFWAELANGTEGIFQANPNQDVLIGTIEVDSISGSNGKEFLVGLEGNDTLIGGNGSDTLVGVNYHLSSPGVNEIDTLSGGNGSDSFMLGNRSQVFYNDGDNLTQGFKDYALITDFTINELIGFAADITNLSLNSNNFKFV